MRKYRGEEICCLNALAYWRGGWKGDFGESGVDVWGRAEGNGTIWGGSEWPVAWEKVGEFWGRGGEWWGVSNVG